MTSESVFSGRLVAIWISASVVLLALSLYFMIRPGGTNPGFDDIGPSTFSRSALGHAALADILERLGIRVVKSRYQSLGKAGRQNLLVLAEPEPSPDILDQASALLNADRVLLVLPKRRGTPSRTHPGWIADSDLIPTGLIERVLSIVDQDAQLAYARHAPVWSTNELGVTPDIPAPIQLIAGSDLRPIVATEQGILLGEAGEGQSKIWI